MWERVVGGVGKQRKQNAIRCGACYYSIVLNAHRVTSMADTDIDAVRKQKKAEYAKQYRLKRKLLLQQQASKDIYMIRYFHPERWKVYVYFLYVYIYFTANCR
jgi:hypothetical protein